MKYELAKKLKDNGFPQKIDTEPNFFKDDKGEPVAEPTLEELIEACGEGFKNLEVSGQGFSCEYGGYIEHCHDNHIGGYKFVVGEYPLEAVANLWLALKKA